MLPDDSFIVKLLGLGRFYPDSIDVGFTRGKIELSDWDELGQLRPYRDAMGAQ
jgi:hypothetical protein